MPVARRLSSNKWSSNCPRASRIRPNIRRAIRSVGYPCLNSTMVRTLSSHWRLSTTWKSYFPIHRCGGPTPCRARVAARSNGSPTSRSCCPSARYIHATASPIGLPPNPGIAEQAQAALPSGLAYFNDALADGQPFLNGAQPTVGDCTLAAALQFARFAKFDLDELYVHLHRWDAEYRNRDVATSVLTL